MSGGQQQRVALARALVNRPTVLLLDEPLGALDLKLRKEMQLELKALQQEVGITFVYVTHDQEEALTMSDMIVVMRDGVIQQQGGPAELYERPANRFVSDFIGTSNFIRASLVETDASGRTTVRTDSGLVVAGHLTDRTTQLAAGTKVTIAVRPERVDVVGADDPDTERSRLDQRGRPDHPGHLPRRSDRVPGPDRAGWRASGSSAERSGGRRRTRGGTGRSGHRSLA